MMDLEPNKREEIASNAWTQACIDLGVKFTSPFQFTTRDGKTHAFVGVVHEFGRPKGTVIGFIGQDGAVLTKELENSSYSWSFFASPAEVECGLKFFQEILDDWGWQGPRERRPAWYTGKPWS